MSLKTFVKKNNKFSVASKAFFLQEVFKSAVSCIRISYWSRPPVLYFLLVWEVFLNKMEGIKDKYTFSSAHFELLYNPSFY